MKRFLCFLLLITAVLTLSSCDWYEKSIRVTESMGAGISPLPDPTGDEFNNSIDAPITDFDQTHNDDGDHSAPDLTEDKTTALPEITENKKTEEPAVTDDHEKTEDTTHSPDYDGNGDGIPDVLESDETSKDPQITAPPAPDIPTPPPAHTESVTAAPPASVDPVKLNALFSLYVNFCNEIGTFNSSDEIDPLAIFFFYRYDIILNDESQGIKTDDEGYEYELIIQTYDMSLLDEITRNMLGQCYNYDALEGRVSNFLGTETTFNFDKSTGNVIGTIKFYGGAGYGPRPYLEYVDYEQNGDEFTINAQYMEMDDNEDFYPVKDYIIKVTLINDRYVMNSYTEKA